MANTSNTPKLNKIVIDGVEYDISVDAKNIANLGNLEDLEGLQELYERVDILSTSLEELNNKMKEKTQVQFVIWEEDD